MEPLQPAMIIITCGHVICTNCDNTKCPECGEYSEGVVQCSHYNLLIGKVNYAKMAIEELNNFIKDW